METNHHQYFRKDNETDNCFSLDNGATGLFNQAFLHSEFWQEFVQQLEEAKLPRQFNHYCGELTLICSPNVKRNNGSHKTHIHE